MRELEQSFTRFRSHASGGGVGGGAGGGEGGGEGVVASGDEDEHKIYARDLVAALGVTEEVAEEMIYIADLQVGTLIAIDCR